MSFLLLAVGGMTVYGDEAVWCLVTDRGHAVAMSDVVCLAAADDDSTFCVVMADGTQLTGIVRATFSRRTPSPVAQSGEAQLTVDGVLSLSGVASDLPVTVYGTDGRQVLTGKAAHLDVSTLRQGTYLLRLDDKTIKFHKR